MSAPPLLAYFDLIDHLRDSIGGSPDEGNQRAIITAIQNAYRELVNARNWQYFWTAHRIQLVEPYSTGTVEYLHTGGTYERQLTLTDGEWPSWALYGKVVIGDVVHSVEDRKSATVLTLHLIHNPGADVDSGTSYTIYRDDYTLPCDFRTMCRPLAEGSGWWGSYVSPEEFMVLSRQGDTSGRPRSWSILGDQNLIGSYAIHVWPYPDADETFDFIYQRSGRQLHKKGIVASEITGTVQTSAASATVTGVGTSFDETMIGSLIRVTTSTTETPTGVDGLNPWLEQKIIVDVTSATSLSVDSVFANNLTGVKFMITDPVDLPDKMITALLRSAEYELAIKQGQKDVLPFRYELKRLAFLSACEADMPIQSMRVIGGSRFIGTRLADMPYTAPTV